MNTYLSRSFRYLLYLIIVWGTVISILFITGYSSVEFGSIGEMFKSTNFIILMVVVVLFAGIYPKINYINRRFAKVSDKSKLEGEFARAGVVKVKEEDGKSYYRYNSQLQRFLMRYEDMFWIEYGDNYTVIDGNRVIITKMWSKIEYFTQK